MQGGLGVRLQSPPGLMVEDPLPRLVHQAQRGDLRAFEEIVRACQGRILRICQRMLAGSAEAQDVAQETFVSAYTHLAKLDPQRSPLPWLTTVATRLCLNRLRSQKRARQEPEEDDLGGGEEPDQLWLRRQDQLRVRQAVLALPEVGRAVVVLYYLEEWNCRQIGEALEMSESNVKVTLHRSRERLRKLLCQS
jgi:RNA polymerase sigma-70 factor (ECF subfamily)